MTVLDLIKASLRVIGAIASSETPDSEMANDAMEALNLLLEDWQNEGLLSLLEQQNFSVSDGTLNYSIGSGETWDGNKPLRILNAHLRDSSGYDHPLSIITDKEYMEIVDKDLDGRPTVLYYLPSNSSGTVYLYPQPDADYTIYMLDQAPFTQYEDLDTTITLPNGYKSALKYNLALEIAPEYETEPSNWVVRQAQKKLAGIKSTNLKPPMPLKFDTVLTGGRGVFNINLG